MPKVKCPISACEYEIDDLDTMIGAALITTHSMIHNTAMPAKIVKVKWPNTTSAGTSKDGTNFLSTWEDYKAATKIVGKVLIIQLPEYCDDALCKDITWAKGSSLTEKSEAEVLAEIC